ncbi:biopolymer transporter ExbD [Cellvibrio sp. pealriver]|uniref:ExbD/TolR family protein n=1 Tax=Cellvibrio sp. pealriver TaxID=1622269 RepID=UPI000B044751|nr:biopolymer transporter ExbD [Cellvibrio sp. pealriver]
MWSKIKRNSEEEVMVEVNISPLIDVVFILLIFFIVTAVFVKESGIDVNRPKATSAEQLEMASTFLAVDENGQLYYSGEKISLNEVRHIVQKNEGRPVVVQVDERALSKVLIQVVDEARVAGAETVSVATEVSRR